MGSPLHGLPDDPQGGLHGLVVVPEVRLRDILGHDALECREAVGFPVLGHQAVHGVPLVGHYWVPDLLEHALEGQCLLNVQTLLKSVKKRASSWNRSIIFITYEPERFLEYSDRFMMLHHGNVVFDGNRNEFAEAENRYLMQYLRSTVEGPMKIL